MKKIVRWFSLAIIVEIIFTFIKCKQSFAILQKDFFISLYLIGPLLLIGLAFLFFFFLTLVNKPWSETCLNTVFRSNKFLLTISLIIIFSLLLVSMFFFITADAIKPDVWKFKYTILEVLDSEIHLNLLPFSALGYVLFWEILILFSFTREEFKGKQKYWLGLPILIAGNFFWRFCLEEAGMYLEPYFFKVYSTESKIVFESYRWWQYLLPIKEFEGYWFSGNIFTQWLGNIIGISSVWYLYQIILITTAFLLSWKVFHSSIFSYFLSICLGFGTHFYNAFQYSSIASLYLLQTLFILLLYFSYEFIRRESQNKRFLLALVPTLLVTAIFYEGWLDFFAAFWAVSLFLFFYFIKRNLHQYLKRLSIIFIIFNIVAGIYIYLKFTYLDFAHATGESAVVFAYGTEYFWRAVEDLVSNYFFQTYMTLSNFLPRAFVTSNALYEYGLELQKEKELVINHYVFFWRYLAGVSVTLFFIGLVKAIKNALHEKKDFIFLPLAIFMIMVAVNSPTHTIIQFRPMKAMPVLGYYVHQGILGFSLCIAYLLHRYKQTAKNRNIVLAVSMIAISIILLGALRRPNYLLDMIKTVGIDHQGSLPLPFFYILERIEEFFPQFYRNGINY